MTPSEPPPASDVRAPMKLRSKGTFLLVSLAVLACDQWSKWVIETHLPEHASRTLVPGLLDLTHVRNTGVAFGLFPAAGDLWSTLLLAAVGVAALVVVAAYFWQTPATRPTLLWALSLVLGGALGNLMDRLASGAVTDFVDLSLGAHRWPAFNLADSAITVGLLVLSYDTLLGRRAEIAGAEPVD